MVHHKKFLKIWFAGSIVFLRSIFNFNLKLAEWRYHDLIMTVGGEDGSKNVF